jgi:hypothetical protein
MQAKSNAMLNEAIVEGIYLFLKDETTVGYDLSKDPHGAVTIEVDEHGNPIHNSRATTPQP